MQLVMAPSNRGSWPLTAPAAHESVTVPGAPGDHLPRPSQKPFTMMTPFGLVSSLPWPHILTLPTTSTEHMAIPRASAVHCAMFTETGCDGPHDVVEVNGDAVGAGGNVVPDGRAKYWSSSPWPSRYASFHGGRLVESRRLQSVAGLAGRHISPWAECRPNTSNIMTNRTSADFRFIA